MFFGNLYSTFHKELPLNDKNGVMEFRLWNVWNGCGGGYALDLLKIGYFLLFSFV